jgi:hypothetical protein
MGQWHLLFDTSSRTYIGHIIPNMMHDDIFLHSLDWDAPFALKYLGYLSIEHLHIDPFTSEIEWMHPFPWPLKPAVQTRQLYKRSRR